MLAPILLALSLAGPAAAQTPAPTGAEVDAALKAYQSAPDDAKLDHFLELWTAFKTGPKKIYFPVQARDAYKRGVAAAQAADYPAAIAAFREVHWLEPRWARPYLAEARALKSAGKADEAKKALKRYFLAGRADEKKIRKIEAAEAAAEQKDVKPASR